MVVGSTQLELLNEYERQQIGERQPLPERYLGVPDEELEVLYRVLRNLRMVRNA